MPDTLAIELCRLLFKAHYNLLRPRLKHGDSKFGGGRLGGRRKENAEVIAFFFSLFFLFVLLKKDESPAITESTIIERGRQSMSIISSKWYFPH